MNTFTRKALYAAIAGVAAIGVASTAKAVNISADGLGQVLIYPYYTVRNNASGLPFNTLMSVVNTTGSVKAIKVRFREGRNSVEVLDFNVFLSPFDVWTATITPTRPTAAPDLDDRQVVHDSRRFTSGGYARAVPDDLRSRMPTTPLTRTGEGYFEIFEMSTEMGMTAAKATHVSGVPACGITEAQAHSPTQRSADRRTVRWRDHRQPGGWRRVLASRDGARQLQPETSLPDHGLRCRRNTRMRFRVSNVIQDGTLFSSVWNNGNDAVTAVLLGNAVTNEYVLDAGTKSQTSWIITMPTKYAYVNGAGAPFAPFTNTYVSRQARASRRSRSCSTAKKPRRRSSRSDDFSPPNRQAHLVRRSAGKRRRSTSQPDPAAQRLRLDEHRIR